MIDYEKVESKYQLSNRPYGIFIDNIIDLLNKFPIRIIGLLFLISALVIISHYNRLSNALTESAAKKNAELYSQALSEFRTLYSSKVVAKLKDKIEITHDYHKKPNAIPLPATLTMELGEKIGQHESGAQVRLYSDYPFPWRKDSGPRDKFEEDALFRLREDPLKPFVSFEDFDDRWSFRYATADIMHPSCVTCHNSHSQSPKTDWKAGDVRGVLEVILPMDLVKSHTRKGIFETIILMIAIIFIGLGILALVIGGLRKSTAIAIRLSTETEQANIELMREIDERNEIKKQLDRRTQELEIMNKELEHENIERKRAEVQIKKSYRESEKNRSELEKFDKFHVDRELKMVELKKEVNGLLVQLEIPEKYLLNSEDS